MLAFKLTAANVDNRTPVRQLTQDIFGKLFGDRGYISQSLFEELYEGGLQRSYQAQEKHEAKIGKNVG